MSDPADWPAIAAATEAARARAAVTAAPRRLRQLRCLRVCCAAACAAACAFSTGWDASLGNYYAAAAAAGMMVVCLIPWMAVKPGHRAARPPAAARYLDYEEIARQELGTWGMCFHHGGMPGELWDRVRDRRGPGVLPRARPAPAGSCVPAGCDHPEAAAGGFSGHCSRRLCRNYQNAG